IGSGGEAKFFLLNNDVFVNGERRTERGKKLYPGDKVVIGNSEYVMTDDQKISLKQLRNHQAIELSFEKSFAYIHGLNGSGKTSILEAIYFCATTKSHRTMMKKK
ncbi:MAG: RNA-binding S4 domain-containing protein, partial [Acholeplasmataceae bacterium]|nr:RNA-binding S4 domain-containing protein [Acholeplasmataceae bacterium]